MNANIRTTLCALCLVIFGSAAQCAAASEDTLYQDLGGQQGIAQVVDNFINEVGNNESILAFFADTNIDRFREKLAEQLCMLSGGPCQYTGDTMAQSHANMDISEADFNLTVDLLIAAMTDAGVPHHYQNRLLARLAKLRGEIIYQ